MYEYTVKLLGNKTLGGYQDINVPITHIIIVICTIIYY